MDLSKKKDTSFLNLSVTDNFKQKNMTREVTPTLTTDLYLPVMNQPEEAMTETIHGQNPINLSHEKRQKKKTTIGEFQMITCAVITLHLAKS